MLTGRVHGRHAASLQSWRQVFSEAVYRVRTERFFRDTNLTTSPTDARRMDFVAAPGARGVGARRGMPIFADATVMSVLTRSGQDLQALLGMMGPPCDRLREPFDWAGCLNSVMSSENSRKVRSCAATHPPQMECTQVVGRF